MPIQVDIRLNGRLLRTIEIARMEPLQSHDAEHEYRVVDYTSGEPVAKGWKFKHKYSDDVTVLVRKAMEALNA